MTTHQYLDVKRSIETNILLLIASHSDYAEFCEAVRLYLASLNEFGLVKSTIAGYYSKRHTIELCIGYDPQHIDCISIIVGNPELIWSAKSSIALQNAPGVIAAVAPPTKSTKSIDAVKQALEKAYDYAMKGI